MKDKKERENKFQSPDPINCVNVMAQPRGALTESSKALPKGAEVLPVYGTVLPKRVSTCPLRSPG